MTAATAPIGDAGPDWLEVVRNNLRRLRYGIVRLVMHAERVTQAGRTEKTRLPAGQPATETAQ